MMLLKPKDVAEKFNTPAEKISNLAKDIENAQLYIFHKTTLGSFLFEEKDLKILKDYQEMLYFFKRKKDALEMLEHQIGSYEDNEEETPDWTKFLVNAKFIT